MHKRCLGCMEQYDSEYNICPYCGYIEGTAVDEAVHMEPGTWLVDRYVIGKVLGFGGFGVTYIGWDEKLEQKVAIKEYLPSEFSTRNPGQASVTVFNGDKQEQFQDGLNKFVEEAKRLSKFQNEPGIVKIFDSFKANSTAYIIMEYLDGETLTSRLNGEGKIPEDEAVSMLLPVMNSLQIIHEHGILHRDIAPDNIFLTKDGEVKLIDFGASRYATTSHSRSLTVIIKPGYSPEEQYRSRGDQGPHTDVYALAATLYKAVTGITPPDALERRASIEAKKKELLPSPRKLNSSISEVFENAILNAMNVQIEDRTLTVSEFCNELKSESPAARRYGKIKPIDFYSWPLWLKVVVPTCLAIILALGLLLATGLIKFPSLFSDDVVVPQGMVIVPDVEGMDKDKALSEIEKAGLLPSPEGNVESEYVEVGKIVLQTPQGGTYLDKDGKVVLTVSSGKGVVDVQDGKATVPYVVWDTQENAVAKLKQAGLGEPTVKTQYDSNVDAGKVISQSVAAGEMVDEGTKITIVVSSGRKSTNTSEQQKETYSLSIKNDSYTVAEGSSVSISLEGNFYYDDLSWTIGDKSIATVDDFGNVKGVSAGNTTLTVTMVMDGKTYSDNCFIKVTQKQYIQSIDLDFAETTMFVGEEIYLSLGTTGASGADLSKETVVWESDNPSVVSIDDGDATALKAGTANITAKAYYDGVYQTSTSCKITVSGDVGVLYAAYITNDSTNHWYIAQAEDQRRFPNSYCGSLSTSLSDSSIDYLVAKSNAKTLGKSIDSWSWVNNNPSVIKLDNQRDYSNGTSRVAFTPLSTGTATVTVTVNSGGKSSTIIFRIIVE